MVEDIISKNIIFDYEIRIIKYKKLIKNEIIYFYLEDRIL